MRYNQLKVFQNGGMIEFRTLENVLITSEPKGSLRIRRTGIIGLSFEQLANGSVVAYVLNFADVLDSSGATYGNTFNEVLLALSAFFELEAAVTQAGNGLSLSGREVQLGGALKKDTTISGAFQLILSGLAAFRVPTNIVQLGDTTWLYFGSETVDGTYRLGVTASSFALQKRISAVWATMYSSDATTKNESWTTCIETIGAGVTRTTVFFTVDLTSTNPLIVYTIPMDANSQYNVELNVNFRRNGSAGGGFARVQGGASRSTLGNGLFNGSMQVLVQENIAGAAPGFTHSVTGNDYNLIIDSNDAALKTRYTGTITIVKTLIPNTF
jgi:hypothetical protein